MRQLIFALALAGCATAPSSGQVASSAAPVIAAERAFARMSIEVGTNQAFRTFSAPDGQVLQPGLVSTETQYLPAQDGPPGGLFWWPAYAGISRSGDLGFTTGPYSGDPARTPAGVYFTVWRLQPDGSWQWLYDGGPPISDFPAVAPDVANVPELPIAARGVGSAAEAVAQVSGIERANATPAALINFLDADSMVNRAAQPRAYGGEAARTLMALPAPDARFTTLRTEASSAGDLVYTLGEVRWSQRGAEVVGHYMRIWQYRPVGWRIVYDQIVPPQPVLTADAVVEAERAFARDATTIGWITAQRRHAAEDAIVLRPGPVDLQDNLAGREGDGQRGLNWRPAFAGMSRAQDFGFTSGPFFLNGAAQPGGHYFTVWRRQSDGALKWIFDAGTDVTDAAPIAADAAVPALPFAAGGAGSAPAAVSEVRALEEENASVAQLAALLTPDVHVNRPGAAPSAGEAAAALFSQAPAAARFRTLRVEGSEEGDLAFTFGEVTGVPGPSHYARIWQRRRAGWRIVFDQVFPRQG